MMEWIRTSEKKPEEKQQIEMTCKHWLANWEGNFDEIYIDTGMYWNGDFWDDEGPRLHDPIFWRPNNCTELHRIAPNNTGGNHGQSI